MYAETCDVLRGACSTLQSRQRFSALMTSQVPQIAKLPREREIDLKRACVPAVLSGNCPVQSADEVGALKTLLNESYKHSNLKGVAEALLAQQSLCLKLERISLRTRANNICQQDIAHFHAADLQIRAPRKITEPNY